MDPCYWCMGCFSEFSVKEVIVNQIRPIHLCTGLRFCISWDVGSILFSSCALGVRRRRLIPRGWTYPMDTPCLTSCSTFQMLGGETAAPFEAGAYPRACSSGGAHSSEEKGLVSEWGGGCCELSSGSEVFTKSKMTSNPFL